MAMHLTELKVKPITELIDTAREMGLENVGRRGNRSDRGNCSQTGQNPRTFMAMALLRFFRTALDFCDPQTALPCGTR